MPAQTLQRQIFQRLAVEDSEIDTASRTIAFTFATPNVARDGHRILPGAWQSRGHDGLANFRKDPVFLWSHNADVPPIGRVTAIAEHEGVLTGTVLFADNDEADKIFRLFKGGFLRATSVSWLPVDWSYATGANRGAGAIDFKRVELLEISAVTVPADPDALVVVRALGLPPIKQTIEDAMPNQDAELIKLANGDRQVRTYRRGSDGQSLPSEHIVTKRGLYEVSCLADVLYTLGYIKMRVDSEEIRENDTDSPSPDNMMAVIQSVGKALIDMSQEEVGELIASFGALQFDDEVGADDAGLRALARRLQGAAVRSGRRLSQSDADELENIHDHARRTRHLARQAADACGSADMRDVDVRAAVTDSAEAVCDHAEQTRCMVRGYIDSRTPAPKTDPAANPENPDDTGDAAADERALRARRAKAMQLRVKGLIAAE